MPEWVEQHYGYWFILALLVIGLFGMLAKQNLMKKVIGMTVFQSAVILFFILGAYRRGATVPIKPHGGHAHDGKLEAVEYLSPLPHTLMLTAIVVGVATVGVALALLILVYRRYGTLEEPRLIERMK